ncbi:MAG: NAD(P)H-hydrate dehydratase [Lachnospiraceae bacterium]|nr:NAD(P)H-hydrate dehydratase [Lachnospiraceae bacterium]
MKQIATTEKMREKEGRIMQKCGIPSCVLMERAAVSAASLIRKRFPTAGAATVLCGMGNNGGDGIALSRILFEKGWQVRLLFVGNPEKRSEENQQQLTILETILTPFQRKASGAFVEVSFFEEESARQQDASCIYVDAMLGIGCSRPLSGDYEKAALWMNAASGFKLSLDVPTGINADTGFCPANEAGEKVFVKADQTITFGAPKPGLFLSDGRYAAGSVTVSSCGIFYQREQAVCGMMPEKSDLKETLSRDPRGHKGSFGKVVLYAGSGKVPGALHLAAKAAFMSGCGYLKVLSDEVLQGPLIAAVPEVVFTSLPREESKLEETILQHVRFGDVIAAGPGIGTGEEACQRLRCLFEVVARESVKPILLLDADALTLLSRHEELWEALQRTKARKILTPHMAEFARLTGLTTEQIAADRLSIALNFAKEKDCVLVLKDAGTLVCSEDGRYALCHGGNDGMAVAGSGDCLLGVIAALSGRRREAFSGALFGVYLHGLAGDKAAGVLGKNSMRPSDLIRSIPAVIKGL